MRMIHVEKMAEKLASDDVIEPCQIDQAIKSLMKAWSDKMAFVWNVSDVQAVGKDMGLIIDRIKARQILLTVAKNHDASVGVNWTVIRDAIDGIV